MTEQEAQITQMQKDIHEIKTKVDDLFTALMGSKVAQDGGLVGRIVELEKENSTLREEIQKTRMELQESIQLLENKAEKSKWMVGVLWIGAGAGLATLISFLLSLLKNAK